jgi:hypothetical protein
MGAKDIEQHRFKKGESGNPKGRPPKGYSISDWFKHMLNEKPEIKDAIAKSILKKALEGDTVAQKLVWNYMDGLPLQQTDITSGGKPVPLFDYAKTRTDNSNQEDTESNQEA